MKKRILKITLWTILMSLAACSNQVKNRLDQPGTAAGSAIESAQHPDTLTADRVTLEKAELTKIYAQAIADYINAGYKKDKKVPDTLKQEHSNILPFTKMANMLAKSRLTEAKIE